MDNIRSCMLAVLLILPAFLFAGEIININTADKETLMSIKGIGEKRAQAIITYRDENGSFKSIEQLADVKGIGFFVVDNNRESLVVKEQK